MLLRHLIVLIINARNSDRALVRGRLSSGLNDRRVREDAAILIGQIKKPKFTCRTVSPQGMGQTSSKASLYNVERSGGLPSRANRPNFALLRRRMCSQWNWWSRSGSNRRPEACKATALPTELRPHREWWARVDSNYRPHAYQACALTT